MMLLSGDWAYEGLSAMLQRRWEADDYTLTRPVLEGYIFEGQTPRCLTRWNHSRS
jgi:hypothetical protein